MRRTNSLLAGTCSSITNLEGEGSFTSCEQIKALSHSWYEAENEEEGVPSSGGSFVDGDELHELRPENTLGVDCTRGDGDNSRMSDGTSGDEVQELVRDTSSTEPLEDTIMSLGIDDCVGGSWDLGED